MCVALDMYNKGEIPLVPECLDVLPASRPRAFQLIAETFGDLLCESAQLLVWLFEQKQVPPMGRHAEKYSAVAAQFARRSI